MTPYFSDWPEINSAIKKDPRIESAVADIVAQMTLPEKIGQMMQPDLREVTPEEVRDFKLGSILNGGGAWPDENKHASAADWAKTADSYWLAIEEAFADRPFCIPFFWATDAVHGHNNVFRATVFPHNIGLGCARDTNLIHRIGQVTAIEVAATGLDWTFAPTVATPRNLRWGRVYEGYSEDPEITYAYAGEMVAGLQGSAEELKSEFHVISNVKHWVGDGGTADGVDRGVNYYPEHLMRNIHAMGYFSGLEAGAQVVMASFNSWENTANYDQSPDTAGEYNYKLHGSRYLLTDVLKDKMGFDGLVVSDWNGHAEVSKCEAGNANYAINAGVDVLMVTSRYDWKVVFDNAITGVETGEIPLARIDDAVTRILRVKMRAGLWNKPKPSQRALAGNDALLGTAGHRALAREAVRKSLVLLKNDNDLLPLSRHQKVLLTGSAANDLQKQTGGWSLTWQGNENTMDDFPGATTMKMALEQTLGKDNVQYDADLSASDLTQIDTAVVVIGEDPYAEMMGDIQPWQSIEFSSLKRSYAKDSALIKQLHEAGVNVITVFFSGRPLYINEEINHSDAFVAAWLPGSEGLGITDVLVKNNHDTISYDFHGQLSYSWPMKKQSAAVHRIPPHIPDYQVPECEQSPEGDHKPLFPFGYGLNYAGTSKQSEYDLNQLPLDNESDDTSQLTTAEYPLELFGRKASSEFQLRIADIYHWVGMDVSGNNPCEVRYIKTTPVNYQHQQDAVRVEFMPNPSAIYVQTIDQAAEDRRSYLQADARLSMDIRILEKPDQLVWLATHKDYMGQPMIDITNILNQLEEKQWQTVEIALSQLAESGVNFRYINTPFMLFTEGSMMIELGNIRWVL